MPHLNCPWRHPVSNFLRYFRLAQITKSIFSEQIAKSILFLNLEKKLSCSGDLFSRYAVGGYDGDKMVSSVEIYDPRLNAWRMGDPMNTPRGYAAAVYLDDSLFLIGGMQSNVQILDTVSDRATHTSYRSILCSVLFCSVLKMSPLICSRWKFTMQVLAGQSLVLVLLGRGPSHLPLSCNC
jgi:hypothetical protein